LGRDDSRHGRQQDDFPLPDFCEINPGEYGVPHEADYGVFNVMTGRFENVQCHTGRPRGVGVKDTQGGMQADRVTGHNRHSTRDRVPVVQQRVDRMGRVSGSDTGTAGVPSGVRAPVVRNPVSVLGGPADR
jgi:hypothetical protein